MSGFMGGWGAHGDAAYRLEPARAERLKVLHEVKQKHLTQAEAAKPLKVTDRQVRRELLAHEKRGDGAVVHGLRGRRSNHKLAASFEQRIVARVRQRYADFGPLAAEHLAQEGLSVSRETLRQWVTRAQLCAQRAKTIRVWRERRACFRELVMRDSSPFRWLEERGPACELIAVIDDATRRLWARLVEHHGREPADVGRLVAALWTTAGTLHRQEQHFSPSQRCCCSARAVTRRRSALAVRTGLEGTGHRMARHLELSLKARTDRGCSELLDCRQALRIEHFSLCPQGGHRISAGCTAGGRKAGQGSRDNCYCPNTNEGKRIPSAHSI